ncbi:MAG: hypothetical protein AAGB04_30080 [Pseudomonadota bacterium]
MNAQHSLDREISNLRFDVDRSRRYHQRRRAHYDRVHQFIIFLVIISGSAAFADALGNAQWFGLATAVLGALDLVGGFSHKSRDHEVLHRRFVDLAAQIELGSSPTEKDLQVWKSKVLAIEADEPPIFWAVDQDCYNEIAVSWERPEYFRKMPPHRRLLKHFMRFDDVVAPTKLSR